ncbi:YceI family protein [Rhodocaloribacter litoris]|uniref:YceI family protein n=1 Tax=Rhodocaloribacter litoris TaxID=2558931 RepID=UPI001423BF9D|nr:YceI family protein [Rhodocaloribacter litoris]QXD14641.1 YceI family protein [Rhodocaloribacter litoris]GIV59585.1 MAG: hypothetical protein KatS3mg043_0674 [Rhodothermaceae bacterium]
MKRYALYVAVLAGLLGLGWSLPGVYTLTAESRLWIDGTSTLHDWTCEATTLTGTLRVPDGAAGLEAGLAGAEVVVPVAGIDCKKDKMNGNLWKALKAEDHPEIRYVLDQATARPGEVAGTFVLETKGRLTVAGVEQPLEMAVTGQVLEDGRYRFAGRTAFSMKIFDVKPPSLMLGTIKTGEDVTVRFDVVAAPAGTL